MEAGEEYLKLGGQSRTEPCQTAYSCKADILIAFLLVLISSELDVYCICISAFRAHVEVDMTHGQLHIQ
jgi:hypothetical protein